MEKPFLSIVICTFNGALFLRDQLDSLFRQTYTNFEIVAIDDNSTDNSFEILQEYALERKNINILRNDHNQGLNHNFQSAIQEAAGDFILTCDQDDIWEPDKLEVMVDKLDGSLLYFHDSALMDEQGAILPKKQSDRFKLISKAHPLSFIALNCVTGHACMFDRKLLDYRIFPFPEHVYYDNWLGYIAATYGDIRYIDQCLVKYRVHGNNLTISQKKSRRLNEDIMKATYAQLDSFYKYAPENAEYKAYLRKLRDTYQQKELKSAFYRAFFFLIMFRKITAFRKKNMLRKMSFCIKLSYKPLPNYFL